MIGAGAVNMSWKRKDIFMKTKLPNKKVWKFSVNLKTFFEIYEKSIWSKNNAGTQKKWKTYADESFEPEARIKFTWLVFARFVLVEIGTGFVHHQVEVQLHHSSEKK